MISLKKALLHVASDHLRIARKLSATVLQLARGPQLRDFTMPAPYEAYSHANTFVDHDWWTPRVRTHKWAKYRMRRDWMKRRNLTETFPERLNYMALSTNTVLPQVFRHKIAHEVNWMRHSHVPVTRTNKLCQLTGRCRGLVDSYRVSRIIFRRLADSGQLSGVMRAYWGQPFYHPWKPNTPPKYMKYRPPVPWIDYKDTQLCMNDPVFQDKNCVIKLSGKIKKVRRRRRR